MSATDEEMHRADGLGIDHVTYALFVSWNFVPLRSHLPR
jgi:hypothetical protein